MADKNTNDPLEELRQFGREVIAQALIKKYADPFKIVLHPWKDEKPNEPLPRQGLGADLDDSQKV